MQWCVKLALCWTFRKFYSCSNFTHLFFSKLKYSWNNTLGLVSSGVSIYIQCQGELKSIIGVPTMTGSKNQDVGCVFHVRYPRKPSENKNKIKFSYFVFITSVTSQYLTCNTQLLRNTLLWVGLEPTAWETRALTNGPLVLKVVLGGKKTNWYLLATDFLCFKTLFSPFPESPL